MFQFSPSKSLHRDLDPYTPVYIHLQCDKYKPDLMERGPDGVYRLLRMVPPGDLSYYFSVENENVYAHD